MTNSLAACAAAALLALIPAGAMAQPQVTPEVTLRLHHFLPADSNTQRNVMEVWEKRVEEASAGRIDVQIYPSMQLGGKPPQLFDQARDGIVEVSWTLLGYTPGRFPIAEVFELPFMSGTAVETTAALQEFQAKYLTDELAQVHVLALHAPAGYKFHMNGAPVTGLADLKGRKIRAPSRAMTGTLNALGATAVGMPVTEVAQALISGVIDGAQLPWEVIGSLRVEGYATSHTEIGSENGGISTSVMALVMNRAAYDALPDDLRAAIDESSGAAMARLAAEGFDRAETDTRAEWLARGARINVIPPDQLQDWRAATQPVVDEWVKLMQDRGLDGPAMLQDAQDMLTRAKGD